MSSKKDNKSDQKQKILDAALAVAVVQGWDRTSLRDIAEKAEISLFDFHNNFEDKADIITYLGRTIDRAVLSGLGEFDVESSPRDRLFDILMDRFEALNEYREGIEAIFDSFKYDPKQAVITMPYLCKSMTWMLEAAGIETNGIRGAIKVAGLTGVYIKVLRTWKEDASADLSKTMAALDKALSRAEKAASTLGF
jgi:ubiquinone biosynthesis protein COQ9